MRFEIVFLFLYDVGRFVDTKRLEHSSGLPHSLDRLAVDWRRDTPESLLLPQALTLVLEDHALDPLDPGSGGFDRLRLRAKVYQDGVVTIDCRAELDCPLEELHLVRNRKITLDNEALTLDEISAKHFQALMDRIAVHIQQDQYYFEEYRSEDYRVFCLLDNVPDPPQFLMDNSAYLAPFLLGESPDISLHASQVKITLKTPFSFTDHDVALFDMDRAFLIAPDRDHEDLLMIVEHANYQLLELRTLDTLLDRLLDDAERDVRQGYRRRGITRPSRRRSDKQITFHPFRAFGSLSQKLGNLQPLRLDALFILENLENSSRIIGDYYLEQIYGHLCGIFNTSGWKRNVERRLEILQSIYTMTKSDATDRTMVLLELLVVLMIGVEIIALFLPVLQH